MDGVRKTKIVNKRGYTAKNGGMKSSTGKFLRYLRKINVKYSIYYSCTFCKSVMFEKNALRMEKPTELMPCFIMAVESTVNSEMKLLLFDCFQVIL